MFSNVHGGTPSGILTHEGTFQAHMKQGAHLDRLAPVYKNARNVTELWILR